MLLYIPSIRTNIRKKCYQGVRVWNNITKHIDINVSGSAFMIRNMKNFTLDKQKMLLHLFWHSSLTIFTVFWCKTWKRYEIFHTIIFCQPNQLSQKMKYCLCYKHRFSSTVARFVYTDIFSVFCWWWWCMAVYYFTCNKLYLNLRCLLCRAICACYVCDVFPALDIVFRYPVKGISQTFPQAPCAALTKGNVAAEGLCKWLSLTFEIWWEFSWVTRTH